MLEEQPIAGDERSLIDDTSISISMNGETISELPDEFIGRMIVYVDANGGVHLAMDGRPLMIFRKLRRKFSSALPDEDVFRFVRNMSDDRQFCDSFVHTFIQKTGATCIHGGANFLCRAGMLYVDDVSEDYGSIDTGEVLMATKNARIKVKFGEMTLGAK